MDGINPLNAGKKKDEALAMLKKYRFSIAQLGKENAVLAKKAAAGDKSSISHRFKEAKLRSDYLNLRRFVDSLPDEITRHTKLPQKSQIISHKE